MRRITCKKGVFVYFGLNIDKLHQLHKYTVLRCMESVLRYPSFYSLKAWVSGCKTKGFRVQNQGFHDLKPMLLQMRGINFEK